MKFSGLYLYGTMISGLLVESGARVSLRARRFSLFEITRVQKIQLSLLDPGSPVSRQILRKLEAVNAIFTSSST